MIKNLLTLTVVVLMGHSGLNAQCTPNTNITQPGLYPTDLPDAEVGITYSEVIQFKFPSDTTISGNTVPIDSVHITDVTGFPSGFSYQCNKSGCRYLGGENGCVVISGNPIGGQEGNYDLSVKGIGYVNFGGSVFPITFEEPLTFSVKNSTFINAIKASEESVSIYPNPFSVSTNITFNSKSTGSVQIAISDITGKEVRALSFRAQAGDNKYELDREGLEEGVYIYSLRLNENTISGRMLIVD